MLIKDPWPQKLFLSKSPSDLTAGLWAPPQLVLSDKFRSKWLCWPLSQFLECLIFPCDTLRFSIATISWWILCLSYKPWISKRSMLSLGRESFRWYDTHRIEQHLLAYNHICNSHEKRDNEADQSLLLNLTFIKWNLKSIVVHFKSCKK